MQRCALCYDQKEKLEGDGRLGFDFTPEELCRSVSLGRCDSCLVILEGLRQSELGRWSFDHDVRRVYARCLVRRGGFQDTLRLEIYFEDERPKVELEFYSLLPHGMYIGSTRSTSHLKTC